MKKISGLASSYSVGCTLSVTFPVGMDHDGPMESVDRNVAQIHPCFTSYGAQNLKILA